MRHLKNVERPTEQASVGSNLILEAHNYVEYEKLVIDYYSSFIINVVLIYKNSSTFRTVVLHAQ